MPASFIGKVRSPKRAFHFPKAAASAAALLLSKPSLPHCLGSHLNLKEPIYSPLEKDYSQHHTMHQAGGVVPLPTRVEPIFHGGFVFECYPILSEAI